MHQKLHSKDQKKGHSASEAKWFVGGSHSAEIQPTVRCREETFALYTFGRRTFVDRISGLCITAMLVPALPQTAFHFQFGAHFMVSVPRVTGFYKCCISYHMKFTSKDILFMIAIVFRSLQNNYNSTTHYFRTLN
jgi:hypothetical protein